MPLCYKLPEGVIVTEDRPFQRGQAAVQGRVTHRYCFDSLRAAALAGDDVFVRGDTHWNHLGALIAFNEAMRAMGLPEMEENLFNPQIKDVDADLSRKIGHRRVYLNEDESMPSCVIFRDSFTSHQLEMFAS